jgi:DNA-directed RNA polymerase subunit M/transcription elongation factor TFIIS
MNHIVNQNNLICPECSGMMVRRQQDGHTYLFCVDCMKILKVVGEGTAELELITTDGKEN